MEQIEWKQNKDKVFFIFENQNQKKLIKVEPKILSILVAHSPKIYYIDLNIDGKNFEYIVDFSDLKPIIQKANKLKIKVKSNVPETTNFEQPSSNFYKITRGESFMDRFLGIKGWQSQEFAFPILPENEIITNKNSPEISTKYTSVNQPKVSAKKQPKTNIKAESTNNIRECKNCGTIITDEIDYCPKCFKPLFDAEKDVDFAI